MLPVAKIQGRQKTYNQNNLKRSLARMVCLMRTKQNVFLLTFAKFNHQIRVFIVTCQILIQMFGFKSRVLFLKHRKLSLQFEPAIIKRSYSWRQDYCAYFFYFSFFKVQLRSQCHCFVLLHWCLMGSKWTLQLHFPDSCRTWREQQSAQRHYKEDVFKLWRCSTARLCLVWNVNIYQE